jgi:O-antigen/teichoic acid export membrane protein
MSGAVTVPSDPIDSDSQTTLLDQAARSVRWSLLYNLLPRLVTPFSAMILAALLTPVDFGLVAIATFVIALARIVVDLGLGKTVIQRRTRVDEAASIGLWVSVLVSVTLYLVLWIAAPAIAAAYDNAKVTDVIRVAAIALPLTALATIPKALLRRNMEYRRLFWVNSSFLIVQAVASVALALAGIGYWAMILGQLIGLLVSVGLIWGMVRWRPVFVFYWPMLRSMLTFSIWVMVSGFQNWLFLYADNAIAGLSLGVRGLGVYSLGFSIAILVPGFLEAAVSDVAYPAFCKLQAAPREVGRSLVKLQTLMAAVLFPIACGISAVAPPAVELLYGQKWQGLGAVIAILVLMPGLNCIWALNENAYQAVGRPDIWPKLAGISLLALLPLLWISAPYGLLVFTLARFGGAWILPIGNVLLGARALDIGIREQLKGLASPLLFSVVMYMAVTLLTKVLSPFVGLSGWVKLLSIIGVGALVYALLIRLCDRALWSQLHLRARQVLA